MSLADEVEDVFASFVMDAVDDLQLELFTLDLRQRATRRESHRERQRIAQRIRPKAERMAINAARKDYHREYRKRERAEKPELVARDRELSRLRAADRRAALRAA